MVLEEPSGLVTTIFAPPALPVGVLQTTRVVPAMVILVQAVPPTVTVESVPYPLLEPSENPVPTNTINFKPVVGPEFLFTGSVVSQEESAVPCCESAQHPHRTAQYPGYIRTPRPIDSNPKVGTSIPCWLTLWWRFATCLNA